MSRRMFDAVTVSQIPAGAQLVAGYADGPYANVPAMKRRFPHALVVPIAIAHGTRAKVADVEKGDMTPESAVLWVRDTMHDVPNHLLTLYANTSTWPSIRSVFATARVTLPQWWAAHYTGVPHFEPGSIATQYIDTGGYDESVVAAYWPGVDPVPAPPAPPAHTTQEDDMLIAYISHKDYTETDWPGDFLLSSTGALRHIATVPDLKELEKTNLQRVTFSREQYESLLAGK